MIRLLTKGNHNGGHCFPAVTMRTFFQGFFKALRTLFRPQELWKGHGLRTPCWVHRNCGREPGGHSARELGVCPAAEAEYHHGTNSGPCAGRICWSLADTDAHHRARGDSMRRLQHCMGCEFFRTVRSEEGSAFKVEL
jgi:hypothetical protein